jgi:NitT/TauT family transport system substrate-binding protein
MSLGGRLVGLLGLLLVIACQVPSRPAPVAAPTASPEPLALKVGLASAGKTYLPFYIAAERTFQSEGLAVELVSFANGPAMLQALAGGSLDVGVGALNNLVSAIAAGHNLKAFYSGVSLADYQWFAAPTIQGWADLRGKPLGISGPGSLQDSLTRTVLLRHGLQPEQEVQLVAVGQPTTALEALKAGRVAAAVLTNPTAWQAQAAGFRQLGTLSSELVDEWPQSVLIASERTIADGGGKLRALLRAQTRAIRLAEADRGVGVEALVKYAKLERPDAERTFDEVAGKMNERGELPRKALPFFWEIAVASGDAQEAWDEARYFDRRFVDSFAEWAPRS